MTREQIFGDRWYLKAGDLKKDGETVTIDDVEMVPVGRDREPKATVRFAEFKKRLILNETQFNAIAELTGEADSDNWTGIRIKLCPATVAIKNGSDTRTVDTIAIEPADPQRKPAEKLTRRTPKPAPVGIQTDADGEAIPF